MPWWGFYQLNLGHGFLFGDGALFFNRSSTSLNIHILNWMCICVNCPIYHFNYMLLVFFGFFPLHIFSSLCTFVSYVSRFVQSVKMYTFFY